VIPFWCLRAGEVRLEFWGGVFLGVESRKSPLDRSMPAPRQRQRALPLLGRAGRAVLQACPCVVCPATLRSRRTRGSRSAAPSAGTRPWLWGWSWSPVGLLGRGEPGCFEVAAAFNIKSQRYLLACLGQVSVVMGCVCTVRACLGESKRGQNQPHTGTSCL